MDLLQREGKYPVPPQAPKTLGVEFSGTIVEFGERVPEGLQIGDDVFGLAYGGELSTYLSRVPGIGPDEANDWQVLMRSIFLFRWICLFGNLRRWDGRKPRESRRWVCWLIDS